MTVHEDLRHSTAQSDAAHPSSLEVKILAADASALVAEITCSVTLGAGLVNFRVISDNALLGEKDIQLEALAGSETNDAVAEQTATQRKEIVVVPLAGVTASCYGEINCVLIVGGESRPVAWPDGWAGAPIIGLGVVDGAFAEGWVADPEQIGSALVSLHFDGQEFWSGSAKPRAGDDRRLWVRVPLPRPGDWEKTCELHLTLSKHPQVRSRPVRFSPRSRLRGNLEVCKVVGGKLRLSGWLQDKSVPTARLGLDICLNEMAPKRVPADVYRSDLKAHGVGDGRHAFQVALPLPEDQQLASCTIRMAETGVVFLHKVFEPAIEHPAMDPGKGRVSVDAAAIAAAVAMIRIQSADASAILFSVPSSIEAEGLLWARVGDHRIGEIALPRDSAPIPNTAAEGEAADAAHITTAMVEIVLPLTEQRFLRYGEISCGVTLQGREYKLPWPEGLAEVPVSAMSVADGSIAEGWVADADGTGHCEVRLELNGTEVWQGTAYPRPGDPRLWFRIRLPEVEDVGAKHSLTLSLPAFPLARPRPVIFSPFARYRGNLEKCEIEGDRLQLSGWLHDKSLPYTPVAFAIRLNGGVATNLFADEFRKDLKFHGIGVGRHAFSVLLPLPEDGPLTECLVEVGKPGVVFARRQFAVEGQAPGLRTEDAATRPSLIPRQHLGNLDVDGRLERAARGKAEGWARYRQCPEIPVLLDVFIDNSYYATVQTKGERLDVRKVFGDKGNYGFYIELPQNMTAFTDPAKVSVRPRFGTSHFRVSEQNLRLGPEALVLDVQPHARPAKIKTGLEPQRPAKIAYVVLNLNGRDMLAALFESYRAHVRWPDTELVLVDHGSTDGSIELCKEWQTRIPLRLLERGRNHSFSASNNFGARATDAEIVVFLNNDIVLHQDPSPGIAEVLQDLSVGIVGIKLFDQRLPYTYQTPAIQHLGVHFADALTGGTIRPFETRFAPHLERVAGDLFEVPSVTGAALACRREEFLALKGFDEAYVYGLEDVDLCLRATFEKDKRIICDNRIGAFHERGYSRNVPGEKSDQRNRANMLLFQQRFGSLLRRHLHKDRFSAPGYWSGLAPVVAFAVTEAKMQTKAGDFFTALELATELQAIAPCQVCFLDKEQNWFDLSGIDVLIVMRDDYDLRRIQNARSNLITVGWARNWMARWAERPWAENYNLIWASSDTSAALLSEKLARPVETVRIAGNPDRFAKGRYDPSLASDYCFTGSFFGAPREIVYNLRPETLPYSFGLFGEGWSEVPEFAPFDRGHLSYYRMPDVYASTRIVVDDANSATKAWGSVNSRVFDAISAGALVVTNGVSGAREVFGDALPTYDSPQELDALLRTYLDDEDRRRAQVQKLQEICASGHTYRHRAVQVHHALDRVSKTQLRFAIKIGAPREAVRDSWGDYHYARGLQRALTRLGHSVRIDCLDRWDGSHCDGDNVVIVLRGLSIFKPRPDQISIMWCISHPKAISFEEFETYDHVFIASEKYTQHIAGLVSVPTTTLLQCTDPEVFHPVEEPPEEGAGERLLFVGNSRNVYRQMVKECVGLGLEVDIYGGGWSQFLPDEMIRGTYLPNEALHAHYSAAKAVLNDHWDDMRDHAFLSNRLFDAGACGAYIITDPVLGLEEVFGDAISVVRTPEQLAAAAALPESDPERVAEMRRKVREIVSAGHSFDARTQEILRVVEEIFDRKRAALAAVTVRS